MKRYEQVLARSPASVDAVTGVIYARWLLSRADEKGKDADAARASEDAYHTQRVAHFQRLVQEALAD